MAEEVKNEVPTSEVKLEAPKMLNGKEVNDIKIRCSRHGDISQGSIYLRYSTIQESTKTIINQNNIMCMCCLNELYTKLQKTPKKITDISYKKDDNGKLILDENGNPIQIVKERVLYLKDKEGNLLPDEKRLTKYGKFIRATSLDELPELINIIKGDMSIVGPRPLLVKYLPLYNEEQRRRHSPFRIYMG